MTDAKQTKCPHCGSTFRISDAQLAAKGGSVRCGSCLQVFRADLHLVGAAPAAPAAATPAAPKPQKKGANEDWAMDLMKKEGAPAAAEDWKLPGDGAASSDEFGFSDDDISEFMEKGPEPEAAPQGKSLLFDDELSDQLDGIEPPGMSGEHETHRISENADESWAQDILSELETEEQKEARKKYSMELVDEKSKGKPKNPKLAAAVGMAPSESAPPAPRAAPPKSTPLSDDFLGDDADVLSFLDDDDLSQGPTSAPPPAANPFSLDRPLAHVDAPVVLKQKRDPIRWGYVLGWTFLCLIAAALFVTQYIYFNFEKLAVDPRARPLFEQVCAKAGCYLPDIPDPSKLRIEELVVRKHPEIEGALVVDAILKNSASFPQPFPVLKLRFSNSADEVIASRQLKPLQYLRGEARLLRRIPPETPVHVSLEIVDPGQEAVSYGLEPQS
jgi:predicted Zn finger-like uncharacterized protein